jgi:NADP-dependent 3-hydroxy acid dehydrogenase YdfG
MAMETDVSGRVVWITGAGSGIGRAMAEGFAAAGARVALTGRNRAALEETAAGCAGDPLVMPGDILDRAGMRGIVEAILAEAGRLDILCANAGLNRPRRYWADLAADPEAAWPEWDEVLDVNIKGLLNSIAAALVPMRAQGDGQVIVTSSWAGRYNSQVAGVAYGAAKHATCDICAQLNMQEGRNGIRATALNPAEVATPLLMKRPGFDASSAARMIQPADMAASALYAARMPRNVAVHEITLAPVRGKE